MSHLPLDARAILEYLNELGYRNISAEQLKEFMKDLRKLIKYEEGLGVEINHDDYFQNLYKRTTASYRARVDEETAQKRQAEKIAQGEKHYPCAAKENIRKFRESSNRKSQSRPLTESQHINRQASKRDDMTKLNYENDKTSKLQPKLSQPEKSRKALEINIAENHKGTQQLKQRKDVAQENTRNPGGFQKALASRELSLPMRQKDDKEQNTNNVGVNLTSRTVTLKPSPSVIISRPKNPKRRTLSNDPVALYQYYQNEWKHFEKQIPGQNTREKVRLEVRNKFK